MLRRQFAILVFAGLAGLCGFGAPAAAGRADQGFIAADPPQPVPMLQFEDGKGRALGLADFKGHYVLLNLWATWCAPCIEEMAGLNALRKKLDLKKFEVVALAEDRDGQDVVRSFYRRHGIDNLPVFTDASGEAPFALHARGLPTTILIGPTGVELARLEGAADWNEKNMVSFLEAQAER